MSDPVELELELRRLRVRADQHWDMAGLARQDGDRAGEERHTRLAREYQAQIGEVRRQRW